MTDLAQAFKILRETYGSHVAVAKHLKISPQHYRYLRNSAEHISSQTATYILLQAEVAQKKAGLHSVTDETVEL